MSSFLELFEESDATMTNQPASAAAARRMFLSTDGTQFKIVDKFGVITLLTLAPAALHLAQIDFSDSPYAAVINETVKALIQVGDGGDTLVDLPTAIGNAGRRVTIVADTPPHTGVLPGAHKLTFRGILGQLINGVATNSLTNAGETRIVESDNVNWLIVG